MLRSSTFRCLPCPAIFLSTINRLENVSLKTCLLIITICRESGTGTVIERSLVNSKVDPKGARLIRGEGRSVQKGWKKTALPPGINTLSATRRKAFNRDWTEQEGEDELKLLLLGFSVICNVVVVVTMVVTRGGSTGVRGRLDGCLLGG